MKTWIKFCGTTSLADALAAIDAGADALGFIFAPSKRRVTMDQARGILLGIPDRVERIGVFVNETQDVVAHHLTELNLTGVQLHGDESAAELVTHLGEERRKKLRIIKTILVKDGFLFESGNLGSASDAVDAWLLDSGAGSGKTFDWESARGELGDRRARFIIAGGLNPENAGHAVKMFRPWGVDVVSGIEREPRRKDPEKMRAFVAAVRKAEQQ